MRVSGLACYVGVDIAQQALQDFASERVHSAQASHRVDVSKMSCLVAADAGKDHLVVDSNDAQGDALPTYSFSSAQWERHRAPLQRFTSSMDIVSCQFALHYMFQTEQRAHHFLEQVRRLLRVGGRFIATTVDSRAIADAILRREFGTAASSSSSSSSSSLLLPSAVDSHERTTEEQWMHIAMAGSRQAESRGSEVIVWRDSLDHEVLRVRYDRSDVRHLLQTAAHDDEYTAARAHPFPYGFTYDFQLYDDPPVSFQHETSGSSSSSSCTSSSSGAAAVNAPEWLVPLSSPLHDMAMQHSLRLVSVKNFHSFIDCAAGVARHRVLMDKMSVFDYQGRISDMAWELSRLPTQ